VFISTFSVAIMAVASILVLAFIFFLALGAKYNKMLAPLNSKEYPLCELYGVGFAILAMFRHNYSSKSERKRKKQIALVVGEKHAEYYLRVNAAQRVTLSFLLATVGFALYGLVDDYLIVGVFLMFAFLAYYYYATLPESNLQKKTNEILSDFADVTSKLALLVNAGMILKEAWHKTAYTGSSELYKEMQRTCVNMNNGMSELDAYAEFGSRCASPEIKKFTSTVVQGLVKGNRELVDMIKQQSGEVWDAKRHRARQQGQKAASKLLIPICIMFIGVIIMIVVPIFANIGV